MIEKQDEIFKASNTSNDGILDREQLRTFILLINEFAASLGLSAQECTEKYLDTVWQCYNSYSPDREGITKDELYYLMAFGANERSGDAT